MKIANKLLTIKPRISFIHKPLTLVYIVVAEEWTIEETTTFVELVFKSKKDACKEAKRLVTSMYDEQRLDTSKNTEGIEIEEFNFGNGLVYYTCTYDGYRYSAKVIGRNIH